MKKGHKCHQILKGVLYCKTQVLKKVETFYSTKVRFEGFDLGLKILSGDNRGEKEPNIFKVILIHFVMEVTSSKFNNNDITSFILLWTNYKTL